MTNYGEGRDQQGRVRTVTEGELDVVAQGALVDRSDTITAGGTSQEFAAANADRQYLLVQNISDAAMWLDFGADPVADAAGSIYLAPNGGHFESASSFCPTDSVNVLCATTGKAVTVKEA